MNLGAIRVLLLSIIFIIIIITILINNLLDDHFILLDYYVRGNSWLFIKYIYENFVILQFIVMVYLSMQTECIDL